MNKTPLIVVAVILALAAAAGWYQYYDERNAVSETSRESRELADDLERAQGELEALRGELRDTRDDLERARASLDQANDQLEAARERAAQAGDTERARAQAELAGVREEFEAAREQLQAEAEQLRVTRDTLLAELAATRRAAEARHKQLIQELATAQGSERAVRSELERLKQLVAKLDQHEQMAARLSRELQGKDADLSSMEAEMAALEHAAAEERDRFAGVQRDLRQELSERDVELQQLTNRLTLIRVGSDIVFQSGSAELTVEGRKTLELVSRILERYPERTIQVEGHTDNVPIGESLRPVYPSNWELSAARAARAVRFLQAAGIEPRRLRVVGHGAQRPESDNDDPATRERNRRIEIAVLPDAPFRVQEVQPQ